MATKKLPVASKHTKELLEYFAGDERLVAFLAAWLENGMNATKAYRAMSPKSTDLTCRVMGSRMLAKVDRGFILEHFGLDQAKYFKQLDQGLGAMKRDQFTGELEEDHKTRLPYHDKLGKLLGVEGASDGAPHVHLNILNHVAEQKNIYGL